MSDANLTLAQAAESSGISLEGLRLAIRRDRLGATLVAGHWEIDPADLDTYLSGRMGGASGTMNGNAVLDEGDIPAIRARLRAGESIRSIAASYAVERNAIHRIKRGDTWTHVP